MNECTQVKTEEDIFLDPSFYLFIFAVKIHLQSFCREQCCSGLGLFWSKTRRQLVLNFCKRNRYNKVTASSRLQDSTALYVGQAFREITLRSKKSLILLRIDLNSLWILVGFSNCCVFQFLRACWNEQRRHITAMNLLHCTIFSGILSYWSKKKLVRSWITIQ